MATHDGLVEVPPAAAPTLSDVDFDVVSTSDDDDPRYARMFHGTPAPSRELQKERPIHRLAACLCAAGMSFKEVARRLNVSPVSVSNWFRQPWFQAFVDEEIMAAGVDPLKNLLAGAAKDSVVTLVELRDDPKVPAATRAKCAMDILDRAYGKAPSVVQHVGSQGAALNEISAVEREIRELMKGPEIQLSLS
jgi:hypothetical protein